MKKTMTLMMTGGLLLSGSAMAWESQDGQHSTSASVALSTDYVWRGYSQTDNKPAISGSFDYGHSSGFYAGIWASNVDFGDAAPHTSIEVDYYAGYAGAFGDSGVSFDLGILRYDYPGEDGLDWNELYGSLSYSYFTLGVAHSGDVYGLSETGTYYNLGFDYSLPMDIGLSAAVGYYDYDDDVFGSGNPDSAVDYRIGLAKDFAGFGFDLSYTDTDSDGEDLYSDDLSDGRLVFTISKSL